MRSSLLHFSYEIFREADRTLLATGETMHIIVNSKLERTALPEKYMQAFNGTETKFMNALQINGNDLSLDDLREVVYERRAVELANGARKKVIAAREVVEKLLRENRVAYAINTGVGKLSDVHIEPATEPRSSR